MADKTPEEKARYKLVKLKAMADRPGTPAEGENAKARIEQILTKFPNLRGKPAPPPRAHGRISEEEWKSRFDFAQWEQNRRSQEARKRAAADAEQARKRKEADERWKRKMADKDSYGEPLTDKERDEARNDPFEWANKRDGRTHAQKQADMNGAWGQANTRFKASTKARSTGHGSPGSAYANRTNPRAEEPRCAKPQTFYDQGGEPRKRNQYVMACEKCGRRLQPGEGAILQVAGAWKGWCAEEKPGPRRKRFE